MYGKKFKTVGVVFYSTKCINSCCSKTIYISSEMKSNFEGTCSSM